MAQKYDAQFIAIAHTNNGCFSSIPQPCKQMAEYDGKTLYKELISARVIVFNVRIETVKHIVIDAKRAREGRIF